MIGMCSRSEEPENPRPSCLPEALPDHVYTIVKMEAESERPFLFIYSWVRPGVFLTYDFTNQ